MISLEDQLGAAMREHTAGFEPAPDLLDRAARGNRRRTFRFAAATGGLGAAAILAVVVAATGTPTAPGEVPRAAPIRPVLTAAEVSVKAVTALSTDDIEHAKVSLRQADKHSSYESWYDPKTGNLRDHDLTTLAGDPKTDVWTIRHREQSTATVTYVDHADRIWWTMDRPDNPAKPSGQTALYSPDELRKQLREGRYQLAGEEKIKGQPVVHLRSDDGMDLWVDADTYRVVRLQIVKQSEKENVTITFDIDWQPRTPEALRPFEFTAPAGYQQVQPY